MKVHTLHRLEGARVDARGREDVNLVAARNGGTRHLDDARIPGTRVGNDDCNSCHE